MTVVDFVRNREFRLINVTILNYSSQERAFLFIDQGFIILLPVFSVLIIDQDDSPLTCRADMYQYALYTHAQIKY